MSANKRNTAPPPFNPVLLDPIPPVKLFDDYFYVGNSLVGFHILRTSEGLVLFDSMDVTDADDKFLIPGLQALGLENEPIRMIFLTHGHFDHYMGADAVRIRTGCDIALSPEDCLFLVNGPDNYMGITELSLPRITRLLKDGEDITFGEHTVHVIFAPGHTPGCLNYSFSVHDRGQEHRILMVGGYGVFGPGNYVNGIEYPYSTVYSVQQALTFAASCVKTWEYAKSAHCDVYLNPHPHLCDLLPLAEKNRSRMDDEPNAFVIGPDGVRKWILERYDVCLKSAEKFTDIRQTYQTEL